MATKKNKNLRFNLKFEKETPGFINLEAILFNNKKEVIEKVDVKERSIEFKSEINDQRKFNLLIVPKSPEASKENNYEVLLEKHKAYKPVIQLGTKDVYELLPIPERFNSAWFKRKCRVTGNVSKVFDINNLTRRKGLCNMRVHICEVDKIRWRLPKIPDYVITKIPDIVLNPEIPMPVPVPVLPELQHQNLKNVNRLSISENLSEIYFSAVNPTNDFRLSKEVQPLLDNKEVFVALKSKSPTLIKEALLKNFDLFHKWFCYIPWFWPYFYRCDKLATVYTDKNGDFDTIISHTIFDQPDLYFWVEAFIDDKWEIVYKPPIPCNTYWNYNCNSDVKITITHPDVLWECTNDLDGELVWIKTINYGTSVSHIQQNSTYGSPIQGKLLNRQGLTDKLETSGNYRRPFGGGLSFIVQFSNDLPSEKYTYYRWSYRKVKNADMSNAYRSLQNFDNTVLKTYSFIFKDINNHFHFDHKSVKLGPFTIGTEAGLCLIPPSSPKDAPFNAPEEDAQWNQDTRSISFNSILDGDGLYEFVLELFDKDGIKITNIPKELFQVPDFSRFTPSINAPAINLVSSGSNKTSAFKMVMRIDNSKTQADIYKIKVDGVEVNPTCCGFVEYKNNSLIEVKFRAYHPNNFADLNFRIKKGTCSDVNQINKTNSKGMVMGDVATNDGGHYSRNTFSEYTKVFTPNDLLGICTSEEKAAFAQYLHVKALATNGYSELNYLDSSGLAAFALDK